MINKTKEKKMFTINKITSNHVVDFAAEKLKKYLRMMMPRCGEIEIKYAPDANNGFRLGVMSDFGLDTSESDNTELEMERYYDQHMYFASLARVFNVISTNATDSADDVYQQ